MKRAKEQERHLIDAIRQCGHAVHSSNQFIVAQSELIELTSLLPLSHLEYWEGLIRSVFDDAVAKATPSFAWRMWPRPRTRLTWLDLISADGYRREKTLRALTGALPNAFVMTLALRRLNDWVPQVRLAARQALPSIARASRPVHVADALCATLAHWGAWGRIEAADKAVLLGIAGERRIADSLKDRLMTSTSGPMPALFAQLGRGAVLDDHVEEIARFAVQPALRAKAYRSLFEQRILWVEGWIHEWVSIRDCRSRWVRKIATRPLAVKAPVSELLNSAAQDRSSLVRRLAAEVLAKELTNPAVAAKELAEQFAADPARTVAERGDFALEKLARGASAAPPGDMYHAG